MDDKKIKLRDATEDQVDTESIFYDTEELKKKGIDPKNSNGSKDSAGWNNQAGQNSANNAAGANNPNSVNNPNTSYDPYNIPPKKRTVGDIIKMIIDKAINFIVCGVLGGVGMFLFLRGFASVTGSFLEVNFPVYWLIGVCVAMGIGMGFLSIFGEAARQKRGNDYMVNARDIQKRQEASESGVWKVMSEEEKQRNERMDQRRRELEAEAEELRSMSESEEKDE